jgi:hypothetical protein
MNKTFFMAAQRCEGRLQNQSWPMAWFDSTNAEASFAGIYEKRQVPRIEFDVAKS